MMLKEYLLLSLCLTLPLASAPDAPTTRPKHKVNTKHRPRYRTKTQRTSKQKHHAKTKQAPKTNTLSKRSRTQHQDHTTADKHNPYAWPTLIIGGTLMTIALITHQTSRRNRIIPPKPIKPVKPNNLNNNTPPPPNNTLKPNQNKPPKPIKPIQPIQPIKPIPNNPPKNNNDNKPKKTGSNNSVMVTDADGRITLVKANPFQLPTGFKTFDINWEKSTLNEAATLASVEQHKGKLKQNIIYSDNAKYIWPFFITLRLLKDTIMYNTKWINIFFQHCTDDYYDTPLPMNTLSEAFANDYLDNKPRFFHRTGVGNIDIILKSGFLKVSKNPRPGCFISQGGTAERGNYGKIIFCFRDLDFYDLPLTCWLRPYTLYIGYWNEVDLHKLLTHVYVEDSQQDKIPLIQQYLKQYNYRKDIKVSTIPQTKIKNKPTQQQLDDSTFYSDQKRHYKRGVFSFDLKIVPAFYPIVGKHSDYYLNKKNGEIVCNSDWSRKNEFKLYNTKDESITFFRGGRNTV